MIACSNCQRQPRQHTRRDQPASAVAQLPSDPPLSVVPAVEYSPFYGIEKGAVLQEARVFNDPHIDPRRCQQVITKLLYLLTQGESFTKVRCCAKFHTKQCAAQQANQPGRHAVQSWQRQYRPVLLAMLPCTPCWSPGPVEAENFCPPLCYLFASAKPAAGDGQHEQPW